jgi:antitoxin CptB
MSGLGSAGRLAKHGGVGSVTTTNDDSVSDWMQPDRPDVRRKRILFRCWHWGTQEGDLILGRFAEAYLADFDLAQLERFEALLDCTDPDLYDWIVVGIAPPEEYNHDVMRLLRSFALMKQKN